MIRENQSTRRKACQSAMLLSTNLTLTTGLGLNMNVRLTVRHGTELGMNVIFLNGLELHFICCHFTV